MAITESAENYLKAIFKLGGEREEVSTGEIARRLGVSAPSVSRMLKRLGAEGWVEHTAYQGVRLTEAGRRQAIRVVRCHRILETYLAKVLGLPWDRVDAEVERLEHVVSEELVNRMEEALGFPASDPHGSPIPDREGNLPVDDGSRPLVEASPGAELVVRRVRDATPDALQYLAKLGVVPGARLRLDGLEPYDGPAILRLIGEGGEPDEPIALGRPLAARVLASPP
jgi:DtxR family Mn-dependent transcriptional regulator